MVHPFRQMFRGGSVVSHVNKCLEEAVRWCGAPCRQMFRGGGMVHRVD